MNSRDDEIDLFNNFVLNDNDHSAIDMYLNESSIMNIESLFETNNCYDSIESNKSIVTNVELDYNNQNYYFGYQINQNLYHEQNHLNQSFSGNDNGINYLNDRGTHHFEMNNNLINSSETFSESQTLFKFS